jgi:hypothetical protein
MRAYVAATCVLFAHSCVVWRSAGHSTSGADKDMLLPGHQPKPKEEEGFCRFVSLDSTPMGTCIGKTSASATGPCYFTANGGDPDGHGNGTVYDNYEVATLPADSRCTVNYQWQEGNTFPDNVLVGGFQSDGASLGLCLAPDGEGQVYMHVPGDPAVYLHLIPAALHSGVSHPGAAVPQRPSLGPVRLER